MRVDSPRAFEEVEVKWEEVVEGVAAEEVDHIFGAKIERGKTCYDRRLKVERWGGEISTEIAKEVVLSSRRFESLKFFYLVVFSEFVTAQKYLMGEPLRLRTSVREIASIV